MTLVVAFGAGLVAALLAWWAISAWWRWDAGAPQMDANRVAATVEEHEGLARRLRQRLDPTVATGSLLAAAGGILVLGGGALGVLVIMVRSKTGFYRFDAAATRFGARHATTLTTDVLRVVTQIGGAVVIVPLAIVVGLIEVWRRRRWSPALFLTIVVGGQFALANLIKLAVDRTRPNLLRLTGFSGPSFPSGHATASAATFVAFALLAGRGRSRTTKGMLAASAVGLAVTVSATRVLLGVHWLTDVTAGLILGWTWFAFTSIAFGGRLLRFGAPVETAERVAESTTDRPEHARASRG